MVFLLTHPVWDVTILPYTSEIERLYFYSHIPCGMWRSTEETRFIIVNFYSHIPCGMWLINREIILVAINFYSHIPCGMWLMCRYECKFRCHFYSHIPCGMWLHLLSIFPEIFISTHTSRVGCDIIIFFKHYIGIISTHTSRVGCDGKMKVTAYCYDNFYSHIPCGMWLSWVHDKHDVWSFLLTHPVWDVTW